MDDLTYIVAEMKRNTDALGFIPLPDLKRRFIQRELYQIIRDGRGRRRGYLIHGPARPGRPLFIHQTLVEQPHRRRLHGARAVQEIRALALRHGATEIRLRCAMDLEANAFWQAIGFRLVALQTGGRRRRRIIARYLLPIQPPETLPAAISAPLAAGDP